MDKQYHSIDPKRRSKDTFKAAYLDLLLLRVGYHCWQCNTGDFLTVDHIVPKKWGGKNEMPNFQLLCIDCHKEKEKQTKFCHYPDCALKKCVVCTPEKYWYAQNPPFGGVVSMVVKPAAAPSVLMRALSVIHRLYTIGRDFLVN
jgi:hypothetical protein